MVCFCCSMAAFAVPSSVDNVITELVMDLTKYEIVCIQRAPSTFAF